MSHDFQLQLIRKTLEDLGHAPVADALAKRISNSASSSQRGSAPEVWGRSIAGESTNEQAENLSSSLNEFLNKGDYDSSVRLFESFHEEFQFANSRIQLTTAQKSLCIYLIHRFAFLEKIVLRSFCHAEGTSTQELVGFLKNDLSAAYNAIDMNSAEPSMEIPKRLTAQLSRERETNLLMSLAMSTISPDSLEQRVFDSSVVLTDPNAPRTSTPLELAAFLNRLRTVLSHNLHEVFLSGSKDDALTLKSWTYHDIPPNCLEHLIRSAVLHNLSKNLYYLPPRLEPYLTENLPVSMILSPSHGEVNRDDLPIHLLHTLTDHSDEVWFTKFSPSGRYLATGSLDGTCNIYDVHNNFTLLAELDANAEDQDSAFNPESYKPKLDKKKGIIYFCWEPYERYIVTCCLDTVLRVWNVEKITSNKAVTGMEDIKLATLLNCFTLGERLRTWSCEFMPYDRATKPHFIVGSPDKVLKAFTIDGNEVLNFYSDAEEWSDILDEEPSQHSTQNTSSRTNSRSDPVTSPTAGTESSTNDDSKASTASSQPFKRVNDFAITSNGKILITANNDKQVFFYKIPDLFDPTATTSRIASLSLYGTLTSCTVSADSRYMLLSIAPEELQLWDISPLEKLQKPFLKQKFVGQSQATYIVRSCLGYLNIPQKKEELVLSGSDDGHIYIWKLETGQFITRIRGHHGLCNSVDWNRFYRPVGHGTDYGMMWSSAGDDKLVKIWGPKPA